MATAMHAARLAELPETEQTAGHDEVVVDEPLLLEEEFDPAGVVAVQEDPSFTPTEDGFEYRAPRRTEWKPLEVGRDLSSWKTDDGFEEHEEQPQMRVGLAVQLAAAAAVAASADVAQPPPMGVQPSPQQCCATVSSVGGLLQKWVQAPCVVTASGAPPQPAGPASPPAPASAGGAPGEEDPTAMRDSATGVPEAHAQRSGPLALVPKAGGSGSSLMHETIHEEDGSKTTVMLRNIPNDYTRQLLLELMDEQGFAAAYDFVYLPMDFKRRAGLGYAFINLADVETAERFLAHFDGFHQWRFDSKKVCQAAWGEPLSTLAQHIERHRNSPLMHEDVPDEFKPAIFQKGVRVDFPKPSKRVRPPRVKF